MATADLLASTAPLASYPINLLLLQPYPLGAELVPAGTLIQLQTQNQAIQDPSYSWSRLIEQSGMPLPLGQPLDQNTFNVLTTLYEKWKIFTVPGPGGDHIDRSQGQSAPNPRPIPPPPNWWVTPPYPPWDGSIWYSPPTPVM